MSKPRLLGIAGSLRRDAYSTQVLAGLREALGAKAELVIHDLADVPLYNQDLDTDAPPQGVARLRAAIGQADGVVIVSPEFNYGLPGVLKNALDWASRPYGAATLTGKPVLTVTESPAFTGGARAQAPLNEVLAAIGARTLLRPQTVIGAVHEKVADGRLTDPASLAFLLAGSEELVAAAAPRPLAQAA